MTDIKQEDRELLAAEYDKVSGAQMASMIRRSRINVLRTDKQCALRAIAKLRAISEAWAKQDGERAMQFDRLREEHDRLLSLLKEAGEIHARYEAKLQARENGTTAAYRVVDELAALAERITAQETPGGGVAA